jgi:hypothetical protein
MTTEGPDDRPTTDEDVLALEFPPYDYRYSMNRLHNDHKTDSLACQGERHAAMVNAKSKSELAERVSTSSEETMNKLLDPLAYAEQSLYMRLSWVRCARARVEAAKTATNWSSWLELN